MLYSNPQCTWLKSRMPWSFMFIEFILTLAMNGACTKDAYAVVKTRSIDHIRNLLHLSYVKTMFEIFLHIAEIFCNLRTKTLNFHPHTTTLKFLIRK